MTSVVQQQCSRCDGNWKVMSAQLVDELLPTATVGRVIGHDHSGPTIEVVRLAMHDKDLFFYVDGKSRLAQTAVGAAVTIEVDNIGVCEEGGWMIVVRGVAHAVDDDESSSIRGRLPRPSKQGLPLCRIVQVSPIAVSGSVLDPRAEGAPCGLREVSTLQNKTSDGG